MDATQYVFPDEPLVTFLYNPFGPEVMAQIARNLKRSDAFVAYVNPFYGAIFQAAGYDIVSSEGGYAIFKSRQGQP